MTDYTIDDIMYSEEPELNPDHFVAVIEASGLQGRPVKDDSRMQRMIEHANLIITARDPEGNLVGVARSLTDYAYCCYLSDLAVVKGWQKKGVGKDLIHWTHEYAGHETKLILLSAPSAMEYYPKAGVPKIDNAFAIDRSH